MGVFPGDADYVTTEGGASQCKLTHQTYCNTACCACTDFYDGDDYVYSACRRTDVVTDAHLGPCQRPAGQNFGCENTGGTYNPSSCSGPAIAVREGGAAGADDDGSKVVGP